MTYICFLTLPSYNCQNVPRHRHDLFFSLEMFLGPQPYTVGSNKGRLTMLAFKRPAECDAQRCHCGHVRGVCRAVQRQPTLELLTIAQLWCFLFGKKRKRKEKGNKEKEKKEGRRERGRKKDLELIINTSIRIFWYFIEFCT